MGDTATSKRYRFSVPQADEPVNEWIEAQDNLSFSIRSLIRDYISKYGMTDATCGDVKRSPGRPPKFVAADDISDSDSNIPNSVFGRNPKIQQVMQDNITLATQYENTSSKQSEESFAIPSESISEESVTHAKQTVPQSQVVTEDDDFVDPSQFF